jgi:hypothetical protein
VLRHALSAGLTKHGLRIAKEALGVETRQAGPAVHLCRLPGIGPQVS